MNATVRSVREAVSRYRLRFGLLHPCQSVYWAEGVTVGRYMLITVHGHTGHGLNPVRYWLHDGGDCLTRRQLNSSVPWAERTRSHHF